MKTQLRECLALLRMAGMKPVPPPKPPTKLLSVDPPKSAGRVAPSPRALKKARIQHHSSRPGMVLFYPKACT